MIYVKCFIAKKGNVSLPTRVFGACWALLECLHHLFVCIKSIFTCEPVHQSLRFERVVSFFLSFSLYVLKSFFSPYGSFVRLQQQQSQIVRLVQEKGWGGKNRENGKRYLSLLIISGFFVFVFQAM